MLGPEDEANENFLVVVRVLRAELNNSAKLHGFVRLDPYVVIEFATGGHDFHEVSRTATQHHGHLHPEWDHTCRGQPYHGRGSCDQIRITLRHRLYGHCSDHVCGLASVEVDELLGEDQESAGGGRGRRSQHEVHSLPLMHEKDEIGKIFVRAVIVHQGHPLGAVTTTSIPDDVFESPAARLGVSGGTAPFFRLLLREPLSGQSREHYIGKDLSRAHDELAFYERALEILRAGPDGDNAAFLPLLGFLFEYRGVVTCDEDRVNMPAFHPSSSSRASAKGAATEVLETRQKPKEMLVLRNLFDGCKKLRLIDLKIGQKTAAGGWQGKSRRSALKQSILDGLTNSCCEGFRLEGFDGRPSRLSSMDPLLDVGGGDQFGEWMTKKAARVIYQRMTSSEVFMYFLDVLQEPFESYEAQASTETLQPTELVELVMHEVVRRLVQLAVACRLSPAPQKWIGSSVALGFDCGSLPPRAESESAVRDRVIVSIFDWGRSELNTLESHMSLSDDEQRDRDLFWQYYRGGIDRLAWEAARAYRHRFGAAKKSDWREVVLTIFDYDSLTANDFLGRVIVPLEATNGDVTVTLLDNSDRKVRGAWWALSSLTYSIEWHDFPAGSRLLGAWRVKVVQAARLPRADQMQFRGTSDPFCEVCALAIVGDAHLCFRQRTSIKPRTLDPVWNEELDIPVAARPEFLQEAVESVSSSFVGMDVDDEMLPPDERPKGSLNHASFVELHRSSKSTLSRSISNLFHLSSSHDSTLETATATWNKYLDKASDGTCAAAADRTAEAAAPAPAKAPAVVTAKRLKEAEVVVEETSRYDLSVPTIEDRDAGSAKQVACCKACDSCFAM
eukprot:TRINITY_DN22179_c0_g8_i1.p1 TRINITY_DN22179_c0_g8~~TRINITY_DN22179_c0_g8_i1.p1  ORF type:complete len:843 (+),score=169.79 TRINITY_DN22179_c0_g8_i1:425-2953(+)